MSEKTYKRATQDVGNMLCMEHVNVLVPDQRVATDFYIGGLGFTRDPYMMVDTDNMWVNVGEQQFHLPTRGQQVLRGHIGLVIPDIEGLKQRLTRLKEKLADTAFDCSVEDGYVAVTGPWGNKFRCYAPGSKFGEMTLGIPYVQFDVEPDTAAGIAKFYKKVMKAPAKVSKDPAGDTAHIGVGNAQELIFRETSENIPSFDGHHIAVYIANFSGPHKFLHKHGLITEETNDFQYRFEDIVDPDSGRHLFKIEHEVRSLYHPMFGRERGFVNRNPEQNLRAYARGHDAYVAV
jgi:catechol 2,3-dioxygenase-like lactoylglutathione lyase family enzyme